MLPRFTRPGRELEQKRTSTPPRTTQPQETEQRGVVQEVSNWWKNRLVKRGDVAAGKAYFDPETQKIHTTPVGFPIYFDPMRNQATLEETGVPLALPARSGIDFSPLWGQYTQMMQQSVEMGGPEMYFDAYSGKITVSPTQYPLYWDSQRMKPTFAPTGTQLRYDSDVELTIDSRELYDSFVGVYGQSADLSQFGFSPLYVEVLKDGNIQLTNERTAYPVYVDPKSGSPTSVNTGIPYIPRADTEWTDAQAQSFLKDFTENRGMQVSTQLSYTWRGENMYFDINTGTMTLEKTPYPIYADPAGNPTLHKTRRNFVWDPSTDEKLQEFGSRIFTEALEVYGDDPVAMLRFTMMMDEVIYPELDPYKRDRWSLMWSDPTVIMTPEGREEVEAILREFSEEEIRARPGDYPVISAAKRHEIETAFNEEAIYIIDNHGRAQLHNPTKLEDMAHYVEAPNIWGISPQAGWLKQVVPHMDYLMTTMPYADAFFHITGYVKRGIRELFRLPQTKERRDLMMLGLNSQTNIDSVYNIIAGYGSRYVPGVSISIPEAEEAEYGPETFEEPSFKHKIGSMSADFVLNQAGLVAYDTKTLRVMKMSEVSREWDNPEVSIQFVRKLDYNLNRFKIANDLYRLGLVQWTQNRLATETAVGGLFRKMISWGQDVGMLPTNEEAEFRMMSIPGGMFRMEKSKRERLAFEGLSKIVKKTGFEGPEAFVMYEDLLQKLDLTMEEAPIELQRAYDPVQGASKLAMASTKKFSHEVLWEQAANLYISGFEMREVDPNRADKELRDAILVDMSGARGEHNPFMAYTITLTEEAMERYLDALVFATKQMGRPLTNYEVWNVKRLHEEPFFEGYVEIAGEISMVWPNIGFAYMFKGLGYGLKTAVKIPGKALRYAGTTLETPVIKQLVGAWDAALKDSSRTIRSAMRDDAIDVFYSSFEHAKLSRDEFPDLIQDVFSAVWKSPNNDVEGIAKMLSTGRAAEFSNIAPSTFRRMTRLAYALKTQWEKAAEAVGEAKRFNHLDRWRPDKIKKTITTLFDDIRTDEYNRTVDILLQLYGDQRLAEKMANEAAGVAARTKRIVSEYMSDTLYRDVSRAMRPLDGSDLLYDSYLYQVLRQFGLDKDKGAMGWVNLWIRSWGWLRNMWIFQVLPGRPAWVIRNIIDSQFRYMVAGGNVLADGLGNVTMLTAGRVFGKGRAYYSAAEAFTRALPGAMITTVKEIVQGKHVARNIPEYLQFTGSVWKKSWDEQVYHMSKTFDAIKLQPGLPSFKHYIHLFTRGMLAPYLTMGNSLKDFNSIAEYSWRMRLIHKASSDIFKKAERISMKQITQMGEELGIDQALLKKLTNLYQSCYDDPDKLLRLMNNIKEGKLDNMVITANMITDDVLKATAHLPAHERDVLLKPILDHLEDLIRTALRRNETVTDAMIDGWIASMRANMKEALEASTYSPIQNLQALKEITDRDTLLKQFSRASGEEMDLSDFARKPEDIIPMKPKKVDKAAVPDLDVIDPTEYTRAYSRLISGTDYTSGERFAVDWGKSSRGSGVPISFVEVEDGLWRITELKPGMSMIQVDIDKLVKMKPTDARRELTKGIAKWMETVDAAEIPEAMFTAIRKGETVNTYLEDMMQFLVRPERLMATNPDKFNFFLNQFGRIPGSLNLMRSTWGDLKVLKMKGVVDANDALRGLYGFTADEADKMIIQAMSEGATLPARTLQVYEKVRMQRAQLGDTIQKFADDLNETLAKAAQDPQLAADVQKLGVQVSYLQNAQRFLSRMLGDRYGGRIGAYLRDEFPGPMAASLGSAQRARRWDDFFSLANRVSERISEEIDEVLKFVASDAFSVDAKISLSLRDILAGTGIKLQIKENGELGAIAIVTARGGHLSRRNPALLKEFVNEMFGDVLKLVDDPNDFRKLYEMPWHELDALKRGITTVRTEEVVQQVQVAAGHKRFIDGLKKDVLEHFHGSDITEQNVNDVMDLVDGMFQSLIKMTGLNEEDFWSKFPIRITREATSRDAGEDWLARTAVHNYKSHSDILYLRAGGNAGNRGTIENLKNLRLMMDDVPETINNMDSGRMADSLLSAVIRSIGMEAPDLTYGAGRSKEIFTKIITKHKKKLGFDDSRVARAVEDLIESLSKYVDSFDMFGRDGVVSTALEHLADGAGFLSARRGSPKGSYFEGALLAMNELFTEILKVKPGLLFRGGARGKVPKTTLYQGWGQLVDDIQLAFGNRNLDEVLDSLMNISGMTKARAERTVGILLGLEDAISINQKVGDTTLGRLLMRDPASWTVEEATAVVKWSDELVVKTAKSVPDEITWKEVFKYSAAVDLLQDEPFTKLATEPRNLIYSAVMRARGALAIEKLSQRTEAYRTFAKDFGVYFYMPRVSKVTGQAAYTYSVDNLLGKVEATTGKHQDIGIVVHEFMHALDDALEAVSRTMDIPGIDVVKKDLRVLGDFFSSTFENFLDVAMKRIGKTERPYFAKNLTELIAESSEFLASKGWMGRYDLVMAAARLRSVVSSIGNSDLLLDVVRTTEAAGGLGPRGKGMLETILDMLVYSPGDPETLVKARAQLQRAVQRKWWDGSIQKPDPTLFVVHPTRNDLKLLFDEEKALRKAMGETLDIVEDLGKNWVKLTSDEQATMSALLPDAIRDAMIRPAVYRDMFGGIAELAKTDSDLATSMRMYLLWMEQDLYDVFVRKSSGGPLDDWWRDYARRHRIRRGPILSRRGQFDEDAADDIMKLMREFIEGKPINYEREGSFFRVALADVMENGLLLSDGRRIPPNPQLLKRLNYSDNQIARAAQEWVGTVAPDGTKINNYDDWIRSISGWSDVVQEKLKQEELWKTKTELWRAFILQPIFGNDHSLLKFFGEDALEPFRLIRRMDDMLDKIAKGELEVHSSFVTSIRFIRDMIANHDFIERTLGEGLGLPRIRNVLQLPVPYPMWKQPAAWQTWMGANMDLMAKANMIDDVLDKIGRNLKEAIGANRAGLIRVPKSEADKVTTWLERAFAGKNQNMALAFEGNMNSRSAAFGRFVDEIGETLGGVKIAGDNMLDYRQSSVIDEALKSIFPFWMFPSRSLVYWVKMLQKHPELLTWYNKFISASQRDLRQKGLVTTQGEPMPSLVGKIRLPGTNMWFDPVQVLSFRFLIPRPWFIDRVTGRYENDEEGMSFEKLFRRAMVAGEFFGFHSIPWAKGYMESLAGDEVAWEQFTIFPVTEMFPPWLADSIRSKLRRTVLSRLADAPFWAPNYQFMDGMIERRMLTRQLERIQEEDDVNEKLKLADDVKAALGYRPKYDYNGDYMGYEVDINRDHPLWKEMYEETHKSQYLLTAVGFFTGWYGREWSDAETQLYHLRHEMNTLRDAINNEILQEWYLPEDLGPREVYDLYVDKRYNTAEGEIFNMAGTLSWVRTPDGEQIDDLEERRERILEIIDENERTSAYWNSIEALNTKLQEDLASIPIGNLDLRRAILDTYFTRRATIDENPIFKEARRSWTFGFKPTEMIEQHFVDLAFQMYRETRPVRDDGENYQLYLTRMAIWERDFEWMAPVILKAIRNTLIDAVTGYEVHDNNVVVPGRRVINMDDLVGHVENELTRENFEKWWRARDTAIDAVERAYTEHYINPYWEFIQGADDRFEREMRSREFREKGAPTEDQLVDWVFEMYDDQFTEDQIRHAIEGRVIDPIENRLSPGTQDERMVQDVWNWLLWAGPSLKELRTELENVGGKSADVDVWYATNGNPRAWGNELNFQKFYLALEKAVDKMGLGEPTGEDLTEWSTVRGMNDKFYRLMKDTLGEEVQLVITRYYNLSGDEQKEFLEQHPEVEQYLILRDTYAVQFPLWAKYFHQRAYREIQEGKTPYWLERLAKQSPASTASGSSGYAPRTVTPRGEVVGQELDRFVPLGYRSSIDPGYLTPHRLGRAGAGGRIKMPTIPTRLANAIGPGGIEEIENLAENGEVISTALENLLEKTKDRYPDVAELVEEILEINRKRRKAYIDRS